MSKHRRPTYARRRTGLAAAALGVAALTTLGASAPALAAKSGAGGKGKPVPTGSYSVSLDQAGPYTFGEGVTATTTAPVYPDGAGPYLWLKCYQDGALVLATDHAGFEGGWYYQDPFWLGPTQSWSGGAADCTLTVVHRSNNKVVTDATTSFHVGG